MTEGRVCEEKGCFAHHWTYYTQENRFAERTEVEKFQHNLGKKIFRMGNCMPAKWSHAIEGRARMGLRVAGQAKWMVYVPKYVRVGETFLFDFPILSSVFSSLLLLNFAFLRRGPTNSMANMIFCLLCVGFATYSQFSLQFGLFRLPIHFLQLATDPDWRRVGSAQLWFGSRAAGWIKCSSVANARAIPTSQQQNGERENRVHQRRIEEMVPFVPLVY